MPALSCFTQFISPFGVLSVVHPAFGLHPFAAFFLSLQVWSFTAGFLSLFSRRSACIRSLHSSLLSRSGRFPLVSFSIGRLPCTFAMAPKLKRPAALDSLKAHPRPVGAKGSGAVQALARQYASIYPLRDAHGAAQSMTHKTFPSSHQAGLFPKGMACHDWAPWTGGCRGDWWDESESSNRAWASSSASSSAWQWGQEAEPPAIGGDSGGASGGLPPWRRGGSQLQCQRSGVPEPMRGRNATHNRLNPDWLDRQHAERVSDGVVEDSKTYPGYKRFLRILDGKTRNVFSKFLQCDVFSLFKDDATTEFGGVVNLWAQIRGRSSTRATAKGGDEANAQSRGDFGPHPFRQGG